ncbi:hypothetical protein VTK73DRAFT_3882 [Phialemonium thermophilum]|uniref:Uncharacterized protein n=1 Tax=Phialemonium thermophilum TaxID=223376 RepID=A0ABR3WXC3_9PEZI
MRIMGMNLLHPMSPFRAIGTVLCLRAVTVLAQTLPTPVICEDSLDGQAPFDANNVPCLLGCGLPVARATGSLLPGSVNETEIPYCQLNCVRKEATPQQSAAAPGCYQSCKAHNQATPENIGWCMYWCVDGLGDLVASTSCVPSLEFGQSATTTVDGTRTLVYERKEASPHRAIRSKFWSSPRKSTPS